MNKSVIRTLILAATIGAAPTQAGAQPTANPDYPTAVVSYADLDLTNVAGQAALNGRVHRAANRLCGTEHRSIAQAMEQRRCHSFAMTSARPQVARAIAMAGTPQFASAGSLTLGRR